MAAHPTIDVEVLPVSGGYYQKLLVMIAGRKGPDVMWMGQSFSDFASRGILLDVADRLARDVATSTINPEALAWYRYGDRQFGVPFGIDVRFMVYNRRLFDEMGLAHPTNDWTIARFNEVVRALTFDRDGDGQTDQFGYMGELDYCLFGATVAAADGSGALCDSPEMIDYLQTNLDLRRRDRVALRGPAKSDEAISAFRQERVAIVQMATWDLPYMRRRFAGMDWDIVANPRGRTHDHWASSQAMVINADTAHPDEAWLLCKAFLTEAFQRDAAAFTIPADRNIARAIVAENTGDPRNLEALLLAGNNLAPNPRVPRMTQVMQSYHEACDAAWSGRLTPAAAMERAAEQINRVLAEAWREGR